MLIVPEMEGLFVLELVLTEDGYALESSTSCKILSFMTSLGSSTSSFSSRMMTDDLGLSFITLPDRNCISCTGTVEIT